MKTTHPASSDDQAFIAGLRQMIAAGPALALVPQAREGFDGLIASLTPPAEAVDFEASTINGVSGWWCKPAQAPSDRAIVFLHGGGYVLGSAAASRNLASQIARRVGVDVFVADYALAPEHPFPAAMRGCLSLLTGLQASGRKKLALVGESAGGGLALALLAEAARLSRAGEMQAPVAALVLSPWIDLALSSPSMQSRQESDPFLSREKLSVAADFYLGATSATDPLANALHSDLEGLPPVEIHVGDSEVLLDDALRYAAALEGAGGQAKVRVWEGMVHVFQMHVAALSAAAQSLALGADFLNSAFENA